MRGALLWLRYRLIRLLVGRMPVVMNMAFFRPSGWRGELWHYPRKNLPAIFHGNELYQNVRHVRALIVPKRDVLQKSALQPNERGASS